MYLLPASIPAHILQLSQWSVGQANAADVYEGQELRARRSDHVVDADENSGRPGYNTS